MSNENETRRREIKARLECAEKTLAATRSSADGHSRAIRLHLEREIHARNKDLALLDVQLAGSGSPPCMPGQETIAEAAAGQNPVSCRSQSPTKTEPESQDQNLG